jgi:glucose-1-phosphate cytidylyltransferase
MKNIKIISTGNDTQTGGRLKQVEDYIENENFLMTYGDGLADVNIDKLLDFHKNNNKTATITVHKPEFRFGVVNFDKNDEVESFVEKPTLNHYVNIGFMVFNKEIFNYLDNDIPLETKPLVNLVEDKQLGAFKHGGFFRPMDTYREYLELNDLWEMDKAPWKPSGKL